MRRRVLLTVLAVCALAVLLFLVPMALIVRSLYQQTDQLELQRLAAAAARQAATDLAATATWTAPAGDSEHR